MPVKTGIQKKKNWIPAFAGMTKSGACNGKML
jgi:hypothetical protein